MRFPRKHFPPLLVVALLASAFVAKGFAVEFIGHRGASHDAPENTLASVNLAWKRGADAVEIDVYLSKDGRIVAIHDETTKRYGGPERKVADQTLAELKSLDVGRWKDRKYTGEKIPTLSEVLATIPDGKRLFIEIKCGPEIIPRLKRVLNAAGKRPEQTAVIDFSYQTIAAVKRTLPAVKAYWVVGLKQHKVTRAWSPELGGLIKKAKAARLDGLDLGNAPAVIDGPYVRRVRAARLKLYVWTVNDVETAVRLKNAGVDGITTDRPGWLRERLGIERLRTEVEQPGRICQNRERASEYVPGVQSVGEKPGFSEVAGFLPPTTETASEGVSP